MSAAAVSARRVLALLRPGLDRKKPSRGGKRVNRIYKLSSLARITQFTGELVVD